MQHDTQGNIDLQMEHAAKAIAREHPYTTAMVAARPGSGISIPMADRINTLADKASSLLTEIETSREPVPEAVIRAAASMHLVLDGYGKAPSSAEVVNDHGLHAKALAEAKARLMVDEQQVTAAMASLDPEIRDMAAEHDSLQRAHQDALFERFNEGKEEGYDKGFEDGRACAFQMIADMPILALVRNRLVAWWATR